MRRVPLIAALLLLGCQSYEAGLGAICDAPSANPTCMGADYNSRGTCLARAVDPTLDNTEARELFDSLGELSNRERAQALRAAAEAAGRDDCPMADVYDWVADQAATDPPSP